MTPGRRGKVQCAVIFCTVLFATRNLLVVNHRRQDGTILQESSLLKTKTKQNIKDKDEFEEYPISVEKWRNKVNTGIHLGANKFIKIPKVMKQNELIMNSATLPTVHYHAIVVPYRTREYHLQQFQQMMNPYIEHHYNKSTSEFSLWIIEQDDTEPFNRGWLANVGISEIIRHTPEVECLTFHDVDFVPDVESNDVKGSVYYNNCSVPTQVGSELFRDGWNWTVGYKEYTGGIVNMHLKHWRAINGFSNDYISWGGEDDDLYIRLNNKDLLTVNRGRKRLIRRPPKGYGRFRSISESNEHHIQDRDKGNNENYIVSKKILERFKGLPERSDFDGLSDLQYKVTHHQVNDKQQGFAATHHIKVKQQLLEFVHIPDTGGKLVEQAAAKVGIPWGACHFRRPNNAKDEMDCPEPADFQHIGLNSQYGEDLWLIPPHLWNINMFQGKHTFTVVRNPFALMISKYHDNERTEHRRLNHGQLALNEFIHSALCQETESKPKYLQHEYVYYNGKQRIPHVLKFENLKREFPQLMKQYDLPVELDPPADDITSFPGRLAIQNLTEQTISLVQLYFAEDFRRFSYPLVLLEEDEKDEMPKETPAICNPPLA